MKKNGIIIGIIVGIILLTTFLFFGKYNSFVNLEEQVNTAWSQVENQYQRRFDLIPNIVNTVKGEANFEKSTLEAVINARASATRTNIDINNVNEIAEFQKQQEGISQALSKLFMLTENYPDLKTNKGFSDLRITLEGTENRISTERMRYNERVQEFNIYARKFPNNIVGAISGFEKKHLFKSESGAEKAPKVEF